MNSLARNISDLLSASVRREIPKEKPERVYRGASAVEVLGMLKPDNGHVPVLVYSPMDFLARFSPNP